MGTAQQRLDRSVGTTEVRRPVAFGLLAVFFLSILGVGMVDVTANDALDALRSWANETMAGWRAPSSSRWTPAGVLQAFDRFERRLEDESFLRPTLLPPVQRALVRTGSRGGEQVVRGSEGWLFFRPDVDAVTGPSFLDPAVQLRRARGGKAWERPASPDPVGALVGFAQQLERWGVDLLVVPVPLKPSIYPELLNGGESVPAPVRNRAMPEFWAQLEAAGVHSLDLAPTLWSARETGEAFLRLDTHWSPSGLDAVAREVARVLQERWPPATVPHGRRSHRPAVVSGTGDTFELLEMPIGSPFAEQEVTAQLVVEPTGRLWRPNSGAEVLLLGDSFTNVFSDAALGWGTGAGLAEQIAYYAQRPIDRIAVNAGGALGAREALARDLATGRDRLAGKKVVVYQFAERELAFGDWREVPLENDRGGSGQ